MEADRGVDQHLITHEKFSAVAPSLQLENKRPKLWSYLESRIEDWHDLSLLKWWQNGAQTRAPLLLYNYIAIYSFLPNIVVISGK